MCECVCVNECEFLPPSHTPSPARGFSPQDVILVPTMVFYQFLNGPCIEKPSFLFSSFSASLECSGERDRGLELKGSV